MTPWLAGSLKKGKRNGTIRRNFAPVHKSPL